jgi:hypothetical protein
LKQELLIEIGGIDKKLSERRVQLSQMGIRFLVTGLTLTPNLFNHLNSLADTLSILHDLLVEALSPEATVHIFRAGGCVLRELNQETLVRGALVAHKMGDLLAVILGIFSRNGESLFPLEALL